jgi:hypothetical protein
MPDFEVDAETSLTLSPVGGEFADFAVVAVTAIALSGPTTSLNDLEHADTSRLSFGQQADARVVLAGDEGTIATLLRTGLSKRFPLWFTETADGVVLITNGIDPMLRWDGTRRGATYAGVPAPATAPQMTITGTTVSTSSYFAFVRFVDAFGNVSDLSPVSEAVLGWTPLPTVTYTDVPLPTGLYASKVFKRQILRNTLGQAATFYVDLETLDLTSSTFVSTKTDDDLSGGEAVPLLDDLNEPAADVHGFPPSWKAVTASHLGRAFAAVEVAYREGHVEVTAESRTVRGVATEWPANFVGRHLHVTAAPESYAIESVDPAAQTLTLVAPYQGPTDLFAHYAIRAPASERRLVYWTGAGTPEGWPPTYAFGVQEDGDEITGLMTMGSFLYVLERRHIYRFTFKDDPATDGGIFLSSRRGCLNARLWVQAEDVAFMLDEMGVHAFSGGESTPVSAPVQDLFRDDSDAPLRINWGADSTLWHASYSEVHATVRFFVAMTGTKLPRHALCFNYRDRRWWIEEYRRPITSSTRGRIGTVRALAGTDHREVIALDVGWTEGARDPTGSLRGTVTSSTALSLSDTSATFASDLVNAPVFLSAGRGKGQWRRIVEVESGTRLNIDRPWLITPDETTEYVAAGVEFLWRSGWFRYADEEGSNPRDVEMVYQPMAAGTMDLRVYHDRAGVGRTYSADRDGSAEVTAGENDVIVDLTDSFGRATHRLEGHRERFVSGDQYVAVELAGVQAGVPVRIYRVTLNGVEDEG